MFVKYLMLNQNDYRGSVKYIVNTDGVDMAYSMVEVKDPDMTILTETEIDMVKDGTDGEWLSHRDRLSMELDALADSVRESYLNVGRSTIDIEYTHVESILRQWVDAGSDANNVPDEIQVWVEVTGQTLEWVINDIESAINGLRAAVTAIRRIRLLGKRDIKSSSDKNIKQTYGAYVEQLESLRKTTY